jgi:hypothetical protein
MLAGMRFWIRQILRSYWRKGAIDEANVITVKSARCFSSALVGVIFDIYSV